MIPHSDLIFLQSRVLQPFWVGSPGERRGERGDGLVGGAGSYAPTCMRTITVAHMISGAESTRHARLRCQVLTQVKPWALALVGLRVLATLAQVKSQVPMTLARMGPQSARDSHTSGAASACDAPTSEAPHTCDTHTSGAVRMHTHVPATSPSCK